MNPHVRANLWLLGLTLLICSVLYPAVLLGLGLTVMREAANGSIVLDQEGKPQGSRLIAQPFTAAEYFQHRPSAAAFKGAASGASNWGASNYLLRERVARQLGPIAKYGSGTKKGQPVGPDIESWFQKDQFGGRPGIVAQWAQAHPTVAQNWVKANERNTAVVAAWQKNHPTEVSAWSKAHPDNLIPQPADLAVLFFTHYAKEYPGTFPGAVEKPAKPIEPVRQGPDIQGIFFDMWRQEHPQADLEPVPADMVMASGSGLDPHITLQNALYQLDRVVAAWAAKKSRERASIRQEIETLLRTKATAPLGGFAGMPPLINVLEVNRILHERYSL